MWQQPSFFMPGTVSEATLGLAAGTHGTFTAVFLGLALGHLVPGVGLRPVLAGLTSSSW